MSEEQSMEWELVGETEVLAENLPHWQSVHYKYIIWPGMEPGQPGQSVTRGQIEGQTYNDKGNSATFHLECVKNFYRSVCFLEVKTAMNKSDHSAVS
jgi:hypothetical protein